MTPTVVHASDLGQRAAWNAGRARVGRVWGVGVFARRGVAKPIGRAGVSGRRGGGRAPAPRASSWWLDNG
jgi:hypothetical protein